VGQLRAVVLRSRLGAVGALFNDSTPGGLCLLSELTVFLSVNLWVYEAGLARTKRPQQNAGAAGTEQSVPGLYRLGLYQGVILQELTASFRA
jgi:hypothetical protein